MLEPSLNLYLNLLQLYVFEARLLQIETWHYNKLLDVVKNCYTNLIVITLYELNLHSKHVIL